MGRKGYEEREREIEDKEGGRMSTNLFEPDYRTFHAPSYNCREKWSCVCRSEVAIS
jgi:hypothetical protein